jgi:hypothetical protein
VADPTNGGEKIKRKTIEQRRRLHQQANEPDTKPTAEML